MNYIFKLFTIIIITSAIGCASKHYSNLTSINPTDAKDENERMLIERSSELYNELKGKGVFYRDVDVQRYLDEVGMSLVPESAKASLL